jgi:hypothetical protein
MELKDHLGTTSDREPCLRTFSKRTDEDPNTQMSVICTHPKSAGAAALHDHWIGMKVTTRPLRCAATAARRSCLYYLLDMATSEGRR